MPHCQALDEPEMLQAYLETCEGVRSALGIEGPAPQLHPLAQGEYNANYWFRAPGAALERLEERGGARSDRLVLRVNHGSQMHLRDQVSYEFRALDLLEACGRTPRTLWCDDSRALAPWGVGVEEFLPGRPLSYQSDLARAARILADVHAVEVPAGAGLQRPQNPLLGIVEECLTMFETYRAWSKAQDAVLRTVGAMAGRALASAQGAAGSCQEDVRRCIVNTELNSHNFLMGEDGQPDYLVDWEKPLVSMAEQDLAHFLVPTTTCWRTQTVLSRPEREAFLDEYERAVNGRFSTEGLRERLGGFMTVTCLRGVTWCAMACVGYTEGGSGLRNEGTLAKIGQFLSADFLQMIWDEFYRD